MRSPDWKRDAEELAKHCTEERKRLGLTRDQLAKLSGLDAGTVRNVEAARHAPTEETRNRILNALSKCATDAG